MARHRAPTAYRQPGYAGVAFVYLLLIGGLAGLVYWLVEHEDRIMAGLRLEMDVAAMTMRVDMPTPPAIRASMVEPLPPPASATAGAGPSVSEESTPPAGDAPGLLTAGEAPGSAMPPAAAVAPIDMPTDTASGAGTGDAVPPADGVANPAAGESISLADMIRQGLSRSGSTSARDAPDGATSAAGEPVRRPQPPEIREQSVGLASDTLAVVEPPTGGPELLLLAPGDGRAAVPDTAVPDTAVPDSAVPDTAVPGSVVPDLTVADSAVADATEPVAGPDVAPPAGGDSLAATGNAATTQDPSDEPARVAPVTSVDGGETSATADAAGEAPATSLAEALVEASSPDAEGDGAAASGAPAAGSGGPVSLSQLDRLAGLEDASSAAALMRPRELNAEPFMVEDGMPLVVLIVQDLGGFHAEAQSAIEILPASVSLAFSPYARDIEPLIRRARGEGHEVLMMLPLETSSGANTDPGSQALRTDLSDEQNRQRLEAINDVTARHVGLIGLGGDRFLDDTSAARLLFGDLSEDGYLFVGSGSAQQDRLLRQASLAGLPTAWVEVDVTATPNAEAVAAALDALEARARETGLAVGVADPFPTFFEQIADWAEGLSARGVALAPVSSAAHISSP
ncbi:MAG: divergent polysaccharide deacetylase family protein [Azospirillaceae bacterium]